MKIPFQLHMSQLPRGVKHIKTGDIYTVTKTVTNATNAQDGQVMVLYRKGRDEYVRELNEFTEKFQILD